MSQDDPSDDISGIPGLSPEPLPQAPAETKDLTNIGELSADLDTSGPSSPSIEALKTEEATAEDFSPLDEPSLEVTPEPAAPPEAAEPAGEPQTPATAEAGVSGLGDYAEKVALDNVVVPAAFPFSVRITGELLPEEKEKLLELLSREKMGIREVDLEPQLAANQILIPRISEYAAVLIVQALRGTSAQLELAPSDAALFSETAPARPPARVSPDRDHPAEALPVTSESSISGIGNYSVLDVVTASAILRTSVVEAESSAAYQEILEALQRELKYKTHYRGGIAILNYHVQLLPLQLPSEYRIQVSGTAVRRSPATV